MCYAIQALKEAEQTCKEADKLALQLSQVKGLDHKGKDVYMTLKDRSEDFKF